MKTIMDKIKKSIEFKKEVKKARNETNDLINEYTDGKIYLSKISKEYSEAINLYGSQAIKTTTEAMDMYNNMMELKDEVNDIKKQIELLDNIFEENRERYNICSRTVNKERKSMIKRYKKRINKLLLVRQMMNNTLSKYGKDGTEFGLEQATKLKIKINKVTKEISDLSDKISDLQ